jgi:AcrR family transcriptional regulator
VDTKTAILEAATELLVASPTGEVSTRAICERAGVGAPTLYRHFGDKDGLMSAVVDHAFERYLAGKRAATPSADPVQDLRDGWDNHVAFALEHPAPYRLMHSVAVPPASAKEAQRLLELVLERCAAAGRLRLPVDVAGQLVMSANVGIALMLVTRPELYDRDTSTRLRDAVHAAILTDTRSKPATRAAVATQLAAQLPAAPLTQAESALLAEWLHRLATTKDTEEETS